MRALAGTGTLVRFILRRDRVRLPLWIIGISAMMVTSAASYPDLYPTAADRQSRAELVDNPSLALLMGGGYGLDDYTYGAMVANELAPFTWILVALMSMLLVVRHTRQEEESGRSELVRAAVVGRHASLTATLIVVGAANLVIGVLVAIGLPASVDGLSTSGSVAIAAGVAAAGLVFTCVALVAAQITEYSRAATGLAGAALAAALALRAAGQIADADVFTWLSPLGWVQETRAYVDLRWWPLVLAVAASAVLVVVATRLSVRRDLGSGLVAAGLGRDRASRSLLSPVGLAVRLQRTSVIAWAVGVFLFGLLYGGIADDAAEFAEDNEVLQDYIARIGSDSLVDSVMGMFLSIVVVAAAIFVLQSMEVLRREESAGRAEWILGTAVSRRHWTSSHLAMAVGGITIVYLAVGLGFGISRAISASDAGELVRLTIAPLAYLPAAWLLAGAAVALFGLVPRAQAAPWVVLGGVLVITWLGPVLDLPSWTFNLSPFEHIPTVPAEGLTIMPLAILLAASAALVVAGLAGIRRRDIATN